MAKTGTLDIFSDGRQNLMMAENNMTPESLQPDAGRVNAENSAPSAPAGKRTNGLSHWSAFELNEFRKDVQRTFDRMASAISGKQFKTESGVASSIGKPNGGERLNRIEGKAGETLREEVTELDHPTDAGLGLAEPEISPTSASPKPQFEPSGT